MIEIIIHRLFGRLSSKKAGSRKYLSIKQHNEARSALILFNDY
jgi:hypothetical protein